VEFLRDKEVIYAYDDVYIKNFKTDFEIRGNFAYVNIKKNKAYFLNARGKFKEFNFEAKKVQQVDKEKFKVYDALITTCPLEDKELKLCIFRANVTKERALIFHNRLKFFNVPIFYFPVYLVPLGGRKTGFLTPTIGSTTYSSFVYIQPFIWSFLYSKEKVISLSLLTTQKKG
jgi:LPS-assembly protein